MSASKFCRNFVHMGSKDNSCHTTGEKAHQDDDPKIQITQGCRTAASINMEEQEHWDIPLVYVFFPGKRKKHHDDHSLASTDCNDIQERSHHTTREKDHPKTRETQGSSDDECNSTVSSTTEICGETDYQNLEICDEETEETVNKADVNSLPVSECDGSFGEKQWSCKTIPVQSVVTKEVESKGKQMCHNEEASNLDYTMSQALPVLDQFEVVKEQSSPSSCHSVNDPGASSSIISFVESMGSAELPHGSTLISGRGVVLTNNGLVSTLVKSSNFKCSRDRKRISNRSQDDGFPKKFVNGKRISAASDTEHEDDVSPPENSQRSTMAQTLLLSETLTVAEEVPQYAVNDCVTTSSLLYSELPPGSTMLTYYGVFRTQDKEKPFMCGYCVTSFNSYPGVCHHVEMQHGEKRYSCEFCGRRYAHQCHLALHVMAHTREKMFTCNQCGRRFRYQGHLRHHMLKHTKDLPYSCRICYKSFKSESYLLKHSKCHKKKECGEGVRRNICKKEFRHDYDLKEHMTTLTTERSVEQKDTADSSDETSKGVPQYTTDKSVEQDDTAGSSDETSRGVPQSSPNRTTNDHVTFSSIVSNMESIDTLKLPPGSTLVSDRGVFHTKDKELPFACGYCGRNYLSKQGVDAHITQHHDQNVSLSCEFCGKFFADQYHLSRHVKSHSRNNQFGCDKYVSKEYMITHSGERPFKCSCCDKDFRVEMHLKFHMITHNENGKLLVTESCDPEENEICEVVQLQEPVLSSNNCSALVKHFPDNANLVESNIRPFQLEDSRTHKKASIPKAPSGFVTTNSRSLRSSTASRLQRSMKSSCDNLYCKISSDSKDPVTKDSQIANTVETSSNESKSKSRPSNSVNGKRISIAAGIVYEDELSSPESLQCCTTTKTLLSEAAKGHPSSSSRQFVNGGGKSSSVRVPVENTVSSKPPPGAVPLYYRYVFYTKDQEKPFSCGYCGKAYKTRRSAYSHVVYIHEEKRSYSCEFCGKRFSQQGSLTSHLRVHTQEKPFTCDQCGRQFRYRTGLRRHKYTHSEERLFSCEKCNMSFRTREVLTRHSETHQTVEERAVVTCNICKRTLSAASNLKQHMRIHSGEKPFKCTICDKQFRLKTTLQFHMYTHDKTNGKSCTVCGKTISRSRIGDHMRMHSGEKPYECSICLKRFPKKQNLEGHMRSHTGEKPFACSGCDKRFALYSNMVTHRTKWCLRT